LTFGLIYVRLTIVRKKGKLKMDQVRKDEILAQTPEQTLADYARIDAIIAKGTYSNK
jgi:hypothetical protein